MRTIFTTLAAILVSGTSALAADVIQDIAPEPIPFVQPFTWTGAYVGVQGGYSNADVDDTNTGLNDADAEGFLGGVHVGYNYQFGAGNGIVVGAYADIDFTTADVENDIAGDDVGDINFIARGMLKLGYGFDRALVYGQGGVAYLDADVNVNLPSFTDGDVSETGYAVGGGIDYAVTDNLVFGADYLYHDFDEVANGNDQFGNDDVDVDAHTFRAKLSYKF